MKKLGYKLEKRRKQKRKSKNIVKMPSSFTFSTMIKEIVIATIGITAFDDPTDVYSFKYRGHYMKSMKIKYESDK